MAKLCPNCGNQMKDEAKFCPACGVASSPAPQQKIQPEPKKEKKKKSKAPIIIIIVLLLLAIAAAVLFILKPWDKTEKNEWQIKVPNVVSSELEKAQDTLTESTLHGLIFDKVEDEKAEKDMILEQSPAADTTVCKGSIVDLTLSAGKEKTFLPDVTGYTFEYANKLLSDAGFKVKQEQLENGEFAPESVGEQSVKSGYVDKGQEITVKVAPKKDASEELVTVPNITGMDVEKAKAELKKVGLYLAVNVAQYSDTAPANQVLNQDKAANSQAKKGETVLVTISLGKKAVYVPDVTYRKLETTKKMLEDAGLTVKEEHAESKEVAKDTVISQSTEAGSGVSENSEVTVTVSDGFEVEVPKVKGLSESDAVEKILEAELAVNVVYRKSDEDLGIVIKQSPKKGETVQIGTAVTIYVSADKDEGEEISGTTAGSGTNGGTVETVKYVNPEQKDFDNIVRLLWTVGFFSDLSTDTFSEDSFIYDSSDSETAIDYAYSKLLDGVFEKFDDLLGWDEGAFSYPSDRSEGDPLGKFAENIGAARYEVFDGQKTDMILQNFFNVTPRHDYYYHSEHGIGAYYYQGKYYTTVPCGGGEPPIYSIAEKRQLSDGSYEILLKLTIHDNPDKAPYWFKVTAGLKDVDGTRMWSLKKIERTTAEEFSASAEKKTENTTTAATTTTTTTTTATTAAQAGWTQKYKEFLTDYIAENGSSGEFSLHYVDADNIPELFVTHGDSHISTVEIYRFDGSGVKKVGDIGVFGEVAFEQKAGTLCVLNYSRGHGIVTTYKMNNNSFEEKWRGVYAVAHMDDNSNFQNEDTVYYINDAKVTETEYNKEFNKNVPKNLLINKDFALEGEEGFENLTVRKDGAEYSLTKANIDRYIK